jgi:ubiquinone/menaquinone biosynthesis C-methylase UbiE
MKCEEIANRATQAELLEQRIVENRASEIDLCSWIFERVQLTGSDQVLELCCGTGNQTLSILSALGEGGMVHALDLSQGALEILVKRAYDFRHKLAIFQADLDNFSSALELSGLERPRFDFVFCAYGLYYSNNPTRVLDEILTWLKPAGRIVVVGPFGPNNAPLFNLVRASGVSIPEPVLFSSERFMNGTIIPWAALRFQTTRISTMVNRVHWGTPGHVLNYWQNTTFYNAQHRPELEARLLQHFAAHAEFINEKWVMMVEMTDARDLGR